LLELGAGFHPEFTGRDNVYMNGSLMGVGRREMERRFPEIESFADIGEYIDQPVKVYSSGMFVRLAFAAAAHVDPQILVIDEALAVGDMGFQQKCLDHLSVLQAKGMTLLIASHDLQLIRNYCTEAIYLHAGNLVEKGNPEAVTETYLRDNAATRQQSFASVSRVESRESPIGGTAFGTSHTKIVHVSLWHGNQESNTVSYGDVLTVRLSVWMDATLLDPRVVIQVRDSRGYIVYGVDSRAAGLTLSPSPDSREVTVAFTFKVELASGHYGLAFRVIDVGADNREVLHEKVVGALGFTVRGQSTAFHGVVDLKAQCEQCGAHSPLESAGRHRTD
jgi:hypothetical protein